MQKLLIIIAIAVIIGAGYYYFAPEAAAPVPDTTEQELEEDKVTETEDDITETQEAADTSNWQTYRNEEYRFEITLVNGWKGYSVNTDRIDRGWLVMLRHPAWSDENQRMDIPILIYTLSQWEKWEAENFESYQTAAPIGPTERARNSRYVFATAPRYNYSFAEGWEEVENIIKTLNVF